MSNECMSMPPLKTCPFCGGEAELLYTKSFGAFYSNIPWGKEYDRKVIRCKRCKVETKKFATKKGCFNAWNMRAGESNE